MTCPIAEENEKLRRRIETLEKAITDLKDQIKDMLADIKK